MKILSTRSLLLFLLLALPGFSGLRANHTIRGSLSCDGINIPNMASVRVNAFDADGDIDDQMGQTYLIDGKAFEIRYENKKWDPFPMAFTTWWRPDIYLTVEIYEENEWITVCRSETYEDWKTNYDLEVHLYVEFNEPLVEATTFSATNHAWPFPALYAEKQSDGRLSGGLSGGLCFSALDKFYNQHPQVLPDDAAVERYLSERQADAGKSGWLEREYARWLSLPDRGAWSKRHSIAYETKVELEKIRAKINAGKPVVLVLIPVPDDGRPMDDIRQVVAYRYEYDQTRQRTRLWLYDPELLREGEAVLTVIHGAPDGTVQLRYQAEKSWRFRGFFVNPYDRKEERKSFAALKGRDGRL